jgi:hypothetical protein
MWSQVFAMTTPWSIKFDVPNLIGFDNLLLEVFGTQVDDFAGGALIECICRANQTCNGYFKQINHFF